MATNRERLNELRALKAGVGASTETPRQRLERMRSLKAQTRPGIVDASPSQLEAGVQGFGQAASFGFTDEIQAGVQTGIQRLGPEEGRRSFKENLTERREAISELQSNNPEAFAAGGVGGAVAAGAAIGGKTIQGAKTIGQAIVRGTGQGAVIGGASGAGFSDSSEVDQTIKDGLEGAANGALFGGAFTLALATPQMIAKTVGSPAYTQALKSLSDKGVKNLTVGQASGSKVLKATESSLGEIPVAGGMINRQIKVGKLQYQKALLKTTGLDDGSKLINDKTLGRARNKIQADYQKALRGKRVDISAPEFVDDINKIEVKHAELLGFEQKRQVQSIVDDIRGKAAQGNGVTGEEYQRLRSRMGKLAFKTKDPEISDLYVDLRNALDDQFQRSAPTPQLAEINRRYANLSSLEDVWKARGASETVEGFLPPSAVAKQASKGRNSTEFKELARSGAIVLPDRTPNSATATRAAILSFIGAGGGAAVGSGNLSGEDVAKLALFGTAVSGVLSRGKGVQSLVTQGAAARGAAAAAGAGTSVVVSGSN